MPKTVFTGEHKKLVTVLIEARRDAALRQSELAQLIGRDQSFVSLLESGQRRVDVVEFIKLAKALGCDPLDLFAEVLRRVGSDIDTRIT